MRDFLKNQFTTTYKERYNETQSYREKYNKLLIKLKHKKEKETELLQKCCGQWLFRWLIIYIIVLSICIPLIVPVLQKVFNLNSNHHKSSTFNLYFLEEIFEYLGLNTMTRVSSVSLSPILGAIMNILQYFGAIESSTNTEYLPNNYIMRSVIPYNEIGNIYLQKSTKLFYNNLFINWKNGELKSFLRIHNIDNTCFERQCYTNTIIQYLKESEENKLLNGDNDKLPIGVLRGYLNHYNINYDQCYNGFWTKDYQCFAEKAASIKILNDVYYGKEYLLSLKGRQFHNKYQSSQREQQSSKQEQIQRQKEDKKNGHFGFQDIGSFAFNLFSGN